MESAALNSAAEEGGNTTDVGLVPSTRDFRIFRYRNPETNRSLKILVCEFENCKKVFRKFHNFYDHLRTHTGERPFVCPYAN